jgi:hypothetical protein
MSVNTQFCGSIQMQLTVTTGDRNIGMTTYAYFTVQSAVTHKLESHVKLKI